MALGIAWGWMQLQPDLYGDCLGFSNFAVFSRPPATVLHLSIWQGEELIAVAPLTWRYQKPCEVGVITPPRPRVRSIIAGLRLVENEIFGPLGYDAFFVRCKEPARRIAEWYGLTETSQRNLFFRSKNDVIRRRSHEATSRCDGRGLEHSGAGPLRQLQAESASC